MLVDVVVVVIFVTNLSILRKFPAIMVAIAMTASRRGSQQVHQQLCCDQIRCATAAITTALSTFMLHKMRAVKKTLLLLVS